jgi:ankyrin repeat protein
MKNSVLENICWEDTDISRLIEPNELDNYRNDTINRHNEIIQMLLDRGGDVNAEDNYGNTVLQFAVPNNRHITVVIQTLLDNGAINNMKKPQYPKEWVELAPPSF